MYCTYIYKLQKLQEIILNSPQLQPFSKNKNDAVRVRGEEEQMGMSSTLTFSRENKDAVEKEADQKGTKVHVHSEHNKSMRPIPTIPTLVLVDENSSFSSSSSSVDRDKEQGLKVTTTTGRTQSPTPTMDEHFQKLSHDIQSKVN